MVISLTKTIIETSGLVGMSKSFREILENCGKIKSIVFCGLPFTCTPIIDFLTHTIRKMECDKYFVPNGDISNARTLEIKELAVQLGKKANISHTDIIVLLGGLAMPDKCDVKDIQNFITKIKGKNTKIIGVGFMDIFSRAGWTECINFDFLQNCDLQITVKEFSKTQFIKI
ncbi:MAG: DUF2124 family protein [Candidatus Methanofastidiosia archaeon]